jgi:hypothetical protein
MVNRVNRARLPEENSADGLLPVEKNSLQLKIYRRIPDFSKVNNLPAFCPRSTFEGSGYVCSNPTAIKIARLAFYLLFPNITGIHAPGINGIVITNRFVAGAWLGVGPDGIPGLTITNPQGPVMSYPLEFADSPLRRRNQRCCFDVLGRNIIDGRVAGFQHAHSLA